MRVHLSMCAHREGVAAVSREIPVPSVLQRTGVNLSHSSCCCKVIPSPLPLSGSPPSPHVLPHPAPIINSQLNQQTTPTHTFLLHILHINAFSGQTFNLQRFELSLADSVNCVNMCTWGCMRMLYNDRFSVAFLNPGWKQTFVTLYRFLNESWWLLVFGDLLRPSLLLCLISTPLHTTPPTPYS